MGTGVELGATGMLEPGGTKLAMVAVAPVGDGTVGSKLPLTGALTLVV
jgi:hypothetical protein